MKFKDIIMGRRTDNFSDQEKDIPSDVIKDIVETAAKDLSSPHT